MGGPTAHAGPARTYRPSQSKRLAHGQLRREQPVSHVRAGGPTRRARSWRLAPDGIGRDFPPAVARGRVCREADRADVRDLRRLAHPRRAPTSPPRQAGVPFRCHVCRFSGRQLAVDDSARAWWLRQFTDAEIANMASAVTGGREPDIDRIGRERTFGARAVSSVGYGRAWLSRSTSCSSRTQPAAFFHT
jgi:hypothetical protein